MKTIKILSYLFVFLVLCGQTVTSQCLSSVKRGEGTYYPGVDGSASGNCGLPVAAGNKLHCALNTVDYNNSNSCGACIEVTGARGKVVLTVVDRCPECKPGDVDLTKEAFARIDDPLKGRIPIQWQFVPCPLRNATNTIRIHFKEGSSRYWTSIQIRNCRDGIKSLEYKKNNRWIPMKREFHNYFTENAGIASPMSLRLTSKYGQRLIFNNVSLNLRKDLQTNKQFDAPSCNNPNGVAFKQLKIPGKIEAEFFNKGKNGEAYKDNDIINRGKSFRQTRVDVGKLPNSRFYVGWTQIGEWLKYTVDVASTGFYNLNVSAGTTFDNAQLKVYVDGKPLRENIKIKNTGDRLKFGINRLPRIRLTKGRHIFRFAIVAQPFTFDFWNVVATKSSLANEDTFDLEEHTEAQVYPNPVSSTLQIMNTGSWSIINLQGKIIRSGKSDFTDISDFPTGFYFVKTDSSVIKIFKN